MMFKSLLFFILLLHGSIGISQNWSIVNESKVTFFKHSDSTFISNTIVIDSVKIIAGSKTYYTGSEVKPCLTCSGYNPIYKYAPEFLGFEIFQDTLSDEFTINGNSLKPKATLNEMWVFNTGITATLSGVGDSLVFGTLDSIKTISLSSGETILISKKNGVLQYPDFENSGTHFSQTGFHEGQNSHGEYLPNFWSTYNFNVGDVFCYEVDSWVLFTAPFYNIKMTILAKHYSFGNDTLKYTVKLLIKNRINYYAGFPEFYYEDFTYNYTENLVFVNDEKLVENSFGLAGFNIDSTEFLAFNKFPFDHNLKQSGGPTSPRYYLNNTVMSSPFGPSKKSVLYMHHSDSLLIQYASSSSYNFTSIFANNYGLIKHSFQAFEGGYGLVLIGAIKNGDTIGTIYDYPADLGLTQYQQNNDLIITPNPAHEFIYFSLNAVRVKIYNLSGQFVFEATLEGQQLDISNLDNGMYLIQVLNEVGETSTGKFLKE